ncbi:TlpA disulfide reductase family protein [Pedobacter sp. Hv1]|uniref:TlpA family protein disulfide reductase n=1 Tax=Pedobacter sp. Hv1 TaxID=1740090 RepID=UPI0006D8BC56|nr:TlpA disulfide reductase family protein [Pedobacter sp. Hv1]KQC00176.1 protein-disulfide isomerase [Pedobacter sp. Hv1]
MKKIVLLLAVLAYTLTATAQDIDKDNITKVGDSIPVFNFEIEKGKTVSISAYKGKLILINLFATWCPPCNAELPEMQSKIWDQYKDNKNFALFVFGREEGWDKLIPYKAKKGFTFPILPDLDRSIFSKFAKQAIPRNILIDQHGKIIYQSLGYDENEFKVLLAIIAKELK